MLDYLASTTARDTESAPLPLERGYRADIARRAYALDFDRDEAERRIERGIRFDDSFPSFCSACASAGIDLLVLTSGIQELVERYLARRNVFPTVIGNCAEYRADGWRIRFRDDSLAGIDKRSFVLAARERRQTSVVIGDDRSDFEAALAADVTYAKAESELAHFLTERPHEFRSFHRFDDILARWPPETWPAEGRRE